MTLVDDVITAKDLGKVIIVRNSSKRKYKDSLTSEDLAWQEARKQRKVRKLDFDIRLHLHMPKVCYNIDIKNLRS